MSMGGLHRGLSGLVAGLGEGRGGREQIGQRRQDKSTAFGPAHVVGIFDYFRQFGITACRRSSQNSQTNQSSKRRRRRFHVGVCP